MRAAEAPTACTVRRDRPSVSRVVPWSSLPPSRLLSASGGVISSCRLVHVACRFVRRSRAGIPRDERVGRLPAGGEYLVRQVKWGRLTSQVRSSLRCLQAAWCFCVF